MVVPHAGTWIEILIMRYASCGSMLSFPTRERGLKFLTFLRPALPLIVVPHAGTWIEIACATNGISHCDVVPHAGTWIEIVWLHISDL